MVHLEVALWEKILSALQSAALCDHDEVSTVLKEIEAADIKTLPVIKKGSVIGFMDSEATLTEDWYGVGLLQVESEGIPQEWEWEFDGTQCHIIEKVQ